MTAPRRAHGGPGAAHGEDGQVMLLSIAYALLVLLLVTAVVSATSVHLQRKRLLALADMAALAAADALDPEVYYSAPVPGESLVRLTSPTVREAVVGHLDSSTEAARFDQLSVVEAGTPDGRTARVTLRAVAHVPLVSWVTAPWSDGIVLQVTAHARAG